MRNFDYYGDLWKIKDIAYSLPGYYQIENATVALATLEILTNHLGLPIDIDDIRRVFNDELGRENGDREPIPTNFGWCA
jgi:folylpolyglutamate synthase/dihydropteroate synthase